MKQTIARTFLFLAAFTLAFGQPTVPVSNLSPLNSGTVVGRTDTGSGRAQTLTAGPGITIANGTISSSGGASAAPAAATYILRTANATLTNAQVLSSLSSGVVTVTTGTGVLASTAPGLAGNVLTSNGTGWASTIPAYTGNVTAAGTLDSGNIVIGQGAKAIATSSVFSISGSNATVSGNLAVTGGMTLNNLTTSNFTVTGNITATGVSNGKLLIGNTTGTKFDIATLTAGDNIAITNTAGGITINATGVGTGNVTVTGTPIAGQLAQWSSASNIVGIASANVTQGGTGLATLTANNIVTGNGTGAVTFIAPGTTGNVVTSNGTAFNSTAPTWFGSAIVSGCTTVTANSTGNLTFASANANLTITTDNTTKTVTLNATGGGGSGNVTNSGTLTSGNLVKGAGTTVVSVSGVTVDGSDNIVTTGNFTANQTISQAFRATGGSLAANSASTTSLDYLAGSNVARWFSQGTNTSTNGGFQIESVRSNGTNSVIVMSYTPATGIAFGASIIGNTTQTGGPRAPYFVVDGTTTNPGGLGANKAVFDHFAATSVSRWFSYGANGSTNGIFTINSQRSDGTNSINILTTDTSGNTTFPISTASTTSTTGAVIISGGVGIAGKTFTGNDVTTSGDFVTDTIGKTLKIKSGSNAKAGTVTLASGAGTISSTAITANSILIIGLKTASGVITTHPYATAVTAGTSYTLAAGAGDNSTYNWALIEVN